jgi:hypothetical protein
MAKTFDESWEHSIYAGTALAKTRKPIFKDGWHARDSEIEAKDKQITELTGHTTKLEMALTKISAIRDSIVGYQNVGFSEHIYPLVAALEEAGFRGIGYEAASKMAKDQIQKIDDLRAEVADMKAQIERVKELLSDGLINCLDKCEVNCQRTLCESDIRAALEGER